MTKLNVSDIETRLALARGWEHHGDMLVKNWHFSSSRRALEFLNQVANLCEQAEYYPDILLRYRCVRIELSTHDEGGLTSLDFDIATAINTLPGDR